MSTARSDHDAFVEDWRQWRRRRENALSDPYGFLAVTGLHWLTAQPQRFPDVPGQWRTGPDGVEVTLAPAELLTLDDEPVGGSHTFGVIPERGGIHVGFDAGILEIARRGGHDIIRPRRPDHPPRLAYRGTPVYPPDPRWLIPGRFVPFDQPRTTTVGAVAAGLAHVYEAPGRVEFAVDGLPLTLTVLNGAAPGGLSVLFTDATSGVTTYPANRTLAIDPPAGDGTVVLDFNRAANMPCAYTDFATCPLPPAGNRLPVAVEAGERIPYERLHTVPPADT